MKQGLMTLLLALGLLFWGWSTQVLWLGALLALVLLMGFALKERYDFEATSFHQMANLGGLIVAAIFAFYWLDDRASKAIMPTLRLLPLAFIPLLIMQYVSKQGETPTSALLFFQRGKKITEQWFDVSVLFLFACLFSAGAMPHEGTLYFTGASALLLALLLLLNHHKHAISNVMIVLVFLVAETMGIGFVYGMNDLQSRMEAKINAWILSYNDGSKTSTAIGAVGRLKLSDDIVFRVKSKNALTIPMLLREGTYQRYVQNAWYGGGWKDIEVPVVDDAWKLAKADEPTQTMRVFQSFDAGKAVLALPDGVTSIRGLNAENILIKQGGRLEVESPPPFAAFDVLYITKNINRSEISRSDFDIPKLEAKSIAEFAKSLNLYQIKHEKGARYASQVLHDYLWNNYTYSTWGESKQTIKKQHTALSYFLWQSKAGHCEYFATVTVLVLREIGIPARYAVGYSLSEYDKDDGLFVVRGRDAHAWAIAWLDEAWVNVDNTPPNWLAVEQGDTALWQSLNDMLSGWVFAFQKWRYNDDEQDSTVWYWLLAVMFTFLAYRVLRRVKTVAQDEALASQQVDEDWLRLEQALADAGYPRRKGETLSHWFARVKGGQWGEVASLQHINIYSEKGLDAANLQAFERSKLNIRQVLKEEKQQRG